MQLKILLFLFLISFSVLAQNSVPFYEKPVWVKNNTYDYKASLDKSEINNGSFYLFYDEQYNLITHQSYLHYAYKISSNEGLQSNSELVFNYNPQYEKFNFNQIIIIREGKKIDYRPFVKINVARREENLENYQIDASLSVIVIFNGLRTGDVIEYSYVKKGINPIFNNKEYLKLYFNSEAKQLRFTYRILYDTSLKFITKYLNRPFNPTKISVKNTIKELEWDFLKVDKLMVEDNCPTWQLPYSTFEISQYQSWEEIENWAFELFKQKQNLSAELIQKCNELVKYVNDDEKKILECIRFVQDEIRYFGIEIGVNSHLPQSPNVTYSRRYGDCKDKSILLCALLNNIGIEANPVLINSNIFDKPCIYLPSPQAFNHVIVSFKFKDKIYFVDATISNQKGDIAHHYCPDYKQGIIVDKERYGFDSIPTSYYTGIYINEDFDVGSITDTTVEYSVTTKYLGDEADNMRSYFLSNASDKIQSSYTEFYNAYYSKIRLKDSIRFTDDAINNIIVVSEKYVIGDLWKQTEKDKRVKATFNSQNLTNYLKPYSALKNNRMSPLTLTYPVHYKQKTSIHFKKPWKINYYNDKVDSKSIYYSFTENAINNDVELIWEFKSLKNNVNLNEYKEFINSVSTVYGSTSYEISDSLYSDSLSDDSERGINWSQVAYYTILLSFLVTVFWRRYRLNR